MDEDPSLDKQASLPGANLERVSALADELAAQAGTRQFYVFLTSGTGAGGIARRRLRTLLAFTTPDAALAFAQRNRLLERPGPRLRRLDLVGLLVLLRDTTISAIILVRESDLPELAGRLPDGIRVERAMLIQRL